jgi:hypothetical protein
MRRLVAVIVLVGTLCMAGDAMAYGGGRKPTRGGRQHVEHRVRIPEFGIWLRFPQPKFRLDGRRREWKREKREGHRYHKCGYPRPRYRS